MFVMCRGEDDGYNMHFEKNFVEVFKRLFPTEEELTSEKTENNKITITDRSGFVVGLIILEEDELQTMGTGPANS